MNQNAMHGLGCDDKWSLSSGFPRHPSQARIVHVDVGTLEHTYPHASQFAPFSILPCLRSALITVMRPSAHASCMLTRVGSVYNAYMNDGDLVGNVSTTYL
jgi:hypothetical protein